MDAHVSWPREPGLPLNPERNGAHQITNAVVPDVSNPGPWLMLWCAPERMWTDIFGNRMPPGTVAQFAYLGPMVPSTEPAPTTRGVTETHGAAASTKATLVYARPLHGRDWADMGIALERAAPGGEVDYMPCAWIGTGSAQRLLVPGSNLRYALDDFELGDDVPSQEKAAEDSCRYSD